MRASMCGTWRARNRNQSQHLWPCWNWCMWCTLNWIIINRQRGGCVPRWMRTFDLLSPQHHKTRRQLQMLFDCCLLHASQPKVSLNRDRKQTRWVVLFQNKDLMTHTEHYNSCWQSQNKHDSGFSLFVYTKIIKHNIRHKKQRTMTLFFCCSPNA